MAKIRIVPLLALVLAFGLAACGDDNGGAADSSAETTATTTETGAADTNPAAPSGEAVRSGKVAMVDFAFEPATVTIQTGGKVIWKNDGEAPHTATADDGSFDTGTVEPGKLKSESFKEAGTFTYVCTIHPQMKGTVEVVD